MLELNKLYLMDCMDGMRQFPDGYFDLAIVDPPYGINRFKHGFAFYGICNRCKATGGTITGEIHCGLVRSRDDFAFYEELAAETWNRRADDAETQP